MPSLKDITGNRYNTLVVLERAENINGRVAWKCLCDCGKETIVRTGDLTIGRNKTCGKCDAVYHSVLYEFKDGYVIGHSTSGKKFYIDEEDLFKIKLYNIYVHKNDYVSFFLNGESMSLHRFLMNPPDDMVVDHINRKPYDNRKSNLRICTRAENQRNTTVSKRSKSGILGVYPDGKCWSAEITINRKKKYLGYFENIEDAIRARKEAELKYFGEFAPK